jgi:hypothetical protein
MRHSKQAALKCLWPLSSIVKGGSQSRLADLVRGRIAAGTTRWARGVAGFASLTAVHGGAGTSAGGADAAGIGEAAMGVIPRGAARNPDGAWTTTDADGAAAEDTGGAAPQATTRTSWTAVSSPTTATDIVTTRSRERRSSREIVGDRAIRDTAEHPSAKPVFGRPLNDGLVGSSLGAIVEGLGAPVTGDTTSIAAMRRARATSSSCAYRSTQSLTSDIDAIPAHRSRSHAISRAVE